ncbi:MAG TPA: sulfite exporter TauE/SafE family protein [Stellaceae bacterium]|nr:sulfite exporter TauE/SafE family protein [Stellaceae bacterium]
MIPLAPWLGLAATCFAAALLQATNGFGFAVLAVPFFLLFAPPGEAIHIIVVISFAVSVFVMPRLYRWVDKALLARLTIGALAALPLGLLALAHADRLVVGASAGTIVTGFAVMLTWYRFRRHATRVALRPGRDLAVGAVAGVATGLVGMAGPPALIYLLLSRAPMPLVRATLIAFFAVIYAVTLIANAVFVGLPARDWLIAASLLPLVWIGGRIGLRVGDRLGETAAAALALSVLGAAGLYTLATSAYAALW